MRRKPGLRKTSRSERVASPTLLRSPVTVANLNTLGTASHEQLARLNATHGQLRCDQLSIQATETSVGSASAAGVAPVARVGICGRWEGVTDEVLAEEGWAGRGVRGG